MAFGTMSAPGQNGGAWGKLGAMKHLKKSAVQESQLGKYLTYCEYIGTLSSE